MLSALRYNFLWYEHFTTFFFDQRKYILNISFLILIMIPVDSLIPFELDIRADIVDAFEKCKYLVYICQPIYRFARTPQLYPLLSSSSFIPAIVDLFFIFMYFWPTISEQNHKLLNEFLGTTFGRIKMKVLQSTGLLHKTKKMQLTSAVGCQLKEAEMSLLGQWLHNCFNLKMHEKYLPKCSKMLKVIKWLRQDLKTGQINLRTNRDGCIQIEREKSRGWICKIFGLG